MPPSDRAAFEQKRTTLQRKIVKWCGVQSIYMPRALEHRMQAAEASAALRRESVAVGTSETNDCKEEEDGDVEGKGDDNDGDDNSKPGPLGMGVNPEDFDLLLPSGLPSHLRATCDPDLLEKEKEIRIALLDTIICSLRKNLRLKAGLYKDKKHHQFGQKAGTRSNVAIEKFVAKIDSNVHRYRAVRAVLLRMDPDGKWKDRLLELNKDDVRAAQHDIEEKESRRRKGLGQGYLELSWIYRMRVASPAADKEEDVAYDNGMHLVFFCISLIQ